MASSYLRLSYTWRSGKKLISFSSTISRCLSSASTDGTLLPLSAIPGPNGSLMNMFEYARDGGIAKQIEIQRKRFDKYGPIFCEKFFNRRIVNIADADAIAKVLRAEPSFPMRPGFEVFEKTLEEHNHVSGLASNNREMWYKERSLLSTKMMQPKEVNKALPGFNDVTRDFIERVRHNRQEDGILPDLEHELFYWAAETISTLLFDQRLGFYNHPPNPAAEVFVKAVLEMTEGLGKFLYGLPLYKYFNTPNYNRFRKAVHTIYTIGQDIVAETESRKREVSVKSSGEERNSSLFDHISDSGEFTSKAVVNILVGMMSAGVDTTTIVVLWTVYLLSRHPQTQEKLYQELRSVLGTETEISSETIGRLSLLRACIKESMRLKPPTIVIPRTLDHDADVLGYNIPAGTEMMLCTHIPSIQEKHYGKDAREFVPERWLRDDMGKKETYHPFTTLPFGYGVRMCIGKRIAEAEISAFLSQLVLNFKMEYAGEGELQQQVSVMVKPDKPLVVKFTPRT